MHLHSLNTIALALLALLAAARPVVAGTGFRHCESPAPLDAAQQGRLLRFNAIVRGELERGGRPVVLLARSGLDLGHLGVRYSHAGYSLRSGPVTRWSVRQLYYACEEARSRLYDQGLAAFVNGSQQAGVGFVSAVMLPAAEADRLARAVASPQLSLALLHPAYSANAYPFSLKYQNCNQWVLEMLAAAWTGYDSDADLSAPAVARPDDDADSAEGARARAVSQRWLRDRGYAPTVFDVRWPLTWLAGFVPWLHSDDHPADDRAGNRYLVSMPASIDSFVRTLAPATTRIEFCHTERHVVVRHGWKPIADGCIPESNDTVHALD